MHKLKERFVGNLVEAKDLVPLGQQTNGATVAFSCCNECGLPVTAHLKKKRSLT